MKKEWADIFEKKTNKIKIENRPYKCTICNLDTERFKASHAYAHHMKARHINHKSFDITLPPPSARKGYTLPKIEKQRKKLKPKHL